jgi:hypothetical protein
MRRTIARTSEAKVHRQIHERRRSARWADDFSGHDNSMNAPCDADKSRATALFHYGNPHLDGKLRKLLRR